MTTQMIGFKIDGQFITDFARQRVIEGCWRHAMSTLDCISGTDYEIRVRILKGEKRFVGVNTFNLEDEDPEREVVKKYLETLHYQYGELLYCPGPGTYWRPYGYVSGYGPQDLGGDRRAEFCARPRGWPWSYEAGSSISGNRGLACGRALHYIDSPRDDALLSLVVPDAPTYEAWVMWKRVEDPPLWAAELGAMEKPQDVLDAHRKARRPFEHRGWVQSYGDLEGEEAHWGARGQTRTEPRPLPEPEPIPEQEYDGPPESTCDIEEIAKRESGWLDREGRFYPCGYSGHRECAEHICATVLDEQEVDDGDQHLDAKGWAKRTLGAGGVWLWDTDKLTKAQKDIILLWYSYRKEKIPFLVKHRIENS